MEKITSFTIDHIRLQPGLYVSRKDAVGSESLPTRGAWIEIASLSEIQSG